MSTRDSRFEERYEGELPASVDEQALSRMETVARLLDSSVRVPGTSVDVGLDPLLGLVPVVGDLTSGALSLYIVAESAYLGVSYGTLVRMLGNVAVDVAGGSVPVVGTVVDAVWRANERNVALALADLAEGSAEDREQGSDRTDGGRAEDADAGVTIAVETE